MNFDKINSWPFKEANKLRKRFKEMPSYPIRFETGFGPSGLPHIGTFAEIARTTWVKNAFDNLTNWPSELIAFSDDMREQNLELKRFLRTNLYRHYRVHRMTTKAARTITALFEAYVDDPRLMPEDPQRQTALREERSGRDGRARAVADYIAGMTDRYAIAEYERTFNPSI